jgi:hypothetical protein
MLSKYPIDERYELHDGMWLDTHHHTFLGSRSRKHAELTAVTAWADLIAERRVIDQPGTCLD